MLRITKVCLFLLSGAAILAFAEGSAHANSGIRNALARNNDPIMQFGNDFGRPVNAIPAAASSLGFESETTEAVLNGYIHSGSYRNFPAALIDRSDANKFSLIVRLTKKATSFSEARRECQSLGDEWDLPLFEYRAQLASLPENVAPILGQFSDAQGRPNLLLATWQRFSLEEDNAIIYEDSESVAIATSYAVADRRYIAELEPKISRIGLDGKFFVDGTMNLDPETLGKERGALTQFESLNFPFYASIHVIIKGYFDGSRSRMPAGLVQPLATYFASNPRIAREVERLVKSKSKEELAAIFLPSQFRNSGIDCPIPDADFELLWGKDLRWKIQAVAAAKNAAPIYFDAQNSHGQKIPLVCMTQIAK